MHFPKLLSSLCYYALCTTHMTIKTYGGIGT